MQKGFIPAVIGLCALVYCAELFGFVGREFVVKYGLNSYFFHGFYWQIATMMFLHGGFLHLAMNMLILWQFGASLEWRMGAARFAALYLAGGVLANLAALPFLSGANFIGASGAVCAVLGFVAFFDRFNRKGLVLWVVLISFLPLLVGLNVAWQVHLCGFAVGFLAAKSRVLL